MAVAAAPDKVAGTASHRRRWAGPQEAAASALAALAAATASARSLDPQAAMQRESEQGPRQPFACAPTALAGAIASARSLDPQAAAQCELERGPQQQIISAREPDVAATASARSLDPQAAANRENERGTGEAAASARAPFVAACGAARNDGPQAAAQRESERLRKLLSERCPKANPEEAVRLRDVSCAARAQVVKAGAEGSAAASGLPATSAFEGARLRALRAEICDAHELMLPQLGGSDAAIPDSEKADSDDDWIILDVQSTCNPTAGNQ